MQCFRNPKAPIAQIHGQGKLMVRFACLLIVSEVHVCKNEGTDMGLKIPPVSSGTRTPLTEISSSRCLIFLLKAPRKKIQL